jgi:hypothetical protein
MSVIYMIHPIHGAKVAISEHEAIYDEMHGWERYDIDTPAEAADVDEGDEDAAEAEPVEVVNELAAPKRRGRPRAKQED